MLFQRAALKSSTFGFDKPNNCMRIAIYFIMIFPLFVSCKDDKKGIIREYNERGLFKSETFFNVGGLLRKEINFNENGTIKSIFNYKNEKLNGEQLWFYDNGKVDQKILFINNRREGDAYFFYRDGILKNFRIFKNGKEVLFGADYWDDSLNLIKSSLHFNDSSEIVYKKNFDSKGNFLNDEMATDSSSKSRKSF
jgi:hypothetical protein